ncbi:cold shock domain-containing protein [Fluoribacter dumoffii]|uniref:Cold shock-like protein CspC n=1 Tax=Fluoribacter dumoffii TaxID=463 RepID=A0A377G847_9GAMM|nr:cold shock domain-containing protein [Fluoribacter dumoffii]KTC89531.1 stress protein, member of the CspA-family [Fluoribacter dumoffii NY 23]MCW8384723.1 cold shock domain-containing protein [Fluoribacter dumoffii]MCW8417787.1 cold shock domain-containing protein [Fluoribacter dumoffii]MCW8454371.1 cold shock domain-containing protein [Fluoribacter dumoffii]MCW8461555.1 cold shock domain-containing protein [Fluoribacter dumoffii]
MSEKIRGTVKWFNERKGFGFIQCDGQDYFVHFSSIQGNGFKKLCEGDHVEFKQGKGQKGLLAEDVQLVH